MTPVPENQSERRVKYGALVGLTMVVVILLATVVVALAERTPKRVDTTASGLYSLKPQTINIITGNTQKIHITSLYTKAKSAEEQQASQQGTPGNTPDVADQADKINDLLEEYRSKGKNIEVDAIDPIANPTKASALIAEVTEKYAGQVSKYQEFVGTDKEAGTYAKAFTNLQDQMDAQMKAVQALPMGQVKSEEMLESFQQVYSGLRGSISDLKQTPEQVKREFLKANPPLYKKASDRIKDVSDDISSKMTAIIDFFTKLKDAKEAKALPDAVQKYLTDSIASYTAIKKQADDLSKQAAGLGELKLDTLSEALRQRNSILVRGESDWKVIPYDQVWRRDPGARVADNASKNSVRFAGEQMITAAIWSLGHPQKLKVAFVRAGGQPVTQAGFPPFVPNGLYANVAEQLRQYNYDVVDKDLTGMAQMQQQQMAPPEPSEEEIRDAVWVVVDLPTSGGQFGGQGPTITPKVFDHLAHGGSALFLIAPQADDMSLALKDWGIELKTSMVAVHEPINPDGARGSELDQALRLPFVFDLHDWGESPVTAPMRSLPGVLIASVPVKTSSAKDVTSWPIIPLPENQKIWADADVNALQNSDPMTLKFDASKGDVAGPINCGAVAEKKGGSRVVVIGSYRIPNDGVMGYRDPEGNPHARAFPGNGEIFMNSVFWLSRQEPMIAISPAAMDVSRLGSMSTATQNVWRGGVLLVLLPAMAIGIGALVFIARRD